MDQTQLGAIVHVPDTEAHRLTLPEAPAFVSDAWQSTVREPTCDDVLSWATLADVATWAKLKGDLS